MNILITGATGLLGKSLVETKDVSDKITGIYLGKYKAKDADGATYRSLDIQDEDAVRSVIRDNDIDVVIHTAGASDVDFCQTHYESAYGSNVVGTRNIINACEEKGIKSIYISTNAVFDGRHPPYKEDDITNPINKYGELKLECEAIVTGRIKDHIIVRPILMYGWNNINERKNLVTALLEKLPKGEPVNMVTDIYDNPLSSRQCAEAVWALMRKGSRGIYHVAGRDIVNRYEYAMEIADVFGLNRGLIKGVDSGFFPNIAPRPKNTSYSTKKLEREIGFSPLGLKEGLVLMKNSRERSL